MDPVVTVAAAFIFGTLIGSFLNVVIWRLPRNEQLTGRSQCPHCHATLTAVNLVPIFSFLLQRGRCAHCQKRISSRYAIIELITGSLFAVITVILAPGSGVEYFLLLKALFFTAILIPVFVIDWEHFLILDRVVYPGIVVMIGLNIAEDILTGRSVLSLASATAGGVLAAAAAGLFFYTLWAISRGRWMGFGDVKLALFLGVGLGWPGIIIGLLLSFWSGALVGIGFLAAGQKTMQSRLPFGTFLAFGSLIALLYGPVLWQFYLKLIQLD